MKIIISAGNGLKREITGAFSVCASAADLRILRDELNRTLEADRPFSYGWVDIIPDRPAVQPNTAPLQWEAE